MKTRIHLETMSDVNKFVQLCEDEKDDIYLISENNKYRVSAKSTLGVILAQAEWKETYCVYTNNAFEVKLIQGKFTEGLS